MKRKIKFISAVFAAGLCLCMTACGGGKKIDLNDYVEIEFNGYDTIGTASVTVDVDQLIEDNAAAFGLEEDYSRSDFNKVYDNLYKKLKGELDKDKKLSNGETVTFKWGSINEDSIKEKYSVSFSYSDISVEVNDLDVPKEFNPFDYIKVTYDGIAPNGKLNISKDGDNPVSGISYRADKTDSLSNGDSITITAESKNDLKEFCLEKGYSPTAETQTYTVSGLTSYAMKLHDIPDETKAKMLNQAEDTIRASCADWREGNSLKQLDFLGYYFLAPKEGFSARPNNEVYCVYKVTASLTGVTADNTKEELHVDESYYTYFYYSDIMILEDGVCSVDLSKGKMSGNRIESDYGYVNFWFTNFTYKGYKELDSMFNDCVAKQTEKYTYESTVE